MFLKIAQGLLATMALTFFGSLPLRLFLDARSSIVTSMLSPREIVVRHCFSGSGFSGAPYGLSESAEPEPLLVLP